MRIRSLLLAIIAMPALAASALAAPKLPGLYFSHLDWELVCDNTGTCRAAGYQGDQDARALSVLLTRRAGAGEPVTGQLLIGQLDDDTASLSMPLALVLYIGGKSAGAGALQADDAPVELPPKAVAALLGALPGTASIEWAAGPHRWRLSGAGAAAVLLKMDDFQGRVGTPGALHRRGTGSEQRLLKAAPAPVVHAVPWGAARPADAARFAGARAAPLRRALRATLKTDDDFCPDLQDEAGARQEPVSVRRLGAQRLLVSTRCWIGAYNVGYGFWVIDDTPAFHPVLVTTMGSDTDEPAITAEHKGRGVGDCRSSDAWTWDGRAFVHTASSVSGMCKQVAAGGAWNLPRLVTSVRQP
jgi:hypothetical protein